MIIRDKLVMTMTNTNQISAMRLDKWLWVARFFKTRQLAIEAINGGKVHLSGQRTKPSKEIQLGSLIRIHKSSLEWEIEVLGLTMQRRSAAEAALLYKEQVDSVARREKAQEIQRLAKASGLNWGGVRPTKKDRRQIHRFTEESG